MNGHKIINQNSLHFLTFTLVGWIDLFTRNIYKDIIVDSLKYCIAEKGLSVHAYVIMSNHIHVIMSAKSGYRLSDIIRDFKKHTSKRIIENLLSGKEESRSEWILKLFKYFAKFNKNNSVYQLWKRDNKPIELVSPKWINQKLAYIHLNPIRANIVDKVEDYVHSSARDYLGIAGLIKIDIIDMGLVGGYIDL